MSEAFILGRLRSFLKLLAALLCLGTMIELGLSEHFESPIQVLPFVLCGLGLVALAADRYRPGRRSRKALRASMLLLSIGGALGIYEHLAANLAFELEIQPSLTASDLWLEALMGASPLLAPGVLGVIAVLVFASTFGVGREG